jgi:hypothetical protein
MFSAALVALLLQSSQTPPCSAANTPPEELGRCLQAIIDGAKSKPNSGTILFRELAKLKGKPKQRAFDRLGYPDRQMKIDAQTVYTWERREPDELTCTVKVIVRGNAITDTDYNGNRGACAYFARRLDPTFSGRD